MAQTLARVAIGTEIQSRDREIEVKNLPIGLRAHARGSERFDRGSAGKFSVFSLVRGMHGGIQRIRLFRGREREEEGHGDIQPPAFLYIPNNERDLR